MVDLISHTQYIYHNFLPIYSLDYSSYNDHSIIGKDPDPYVLYPIYHNQYNNHNILPIYLPEVLLP